MRPLYDLSWEEFCGRAPFVQETENPNDPVFDMIAMWEGNESWKTWQLLPMVVPIGKYALWADRARRGNETRIILSEGDHLAGLYEYEPDPSTPGGVTDMLGILGAHRGRCLGRELLIAAYNVAPWHNVQRKFTQAGFRTFVRAFGLALDKAVRDGHLTKEAAAHKHATLPFVHPRNGKPCPGILEP